VGRLVRRLVRRLVGRGAVGWLVHWWALDWGSAVRRYVSRWRLDGGLAVRRWLGCAVWRVLDLRLRLTVRGLISWVR
jgi:hypothetical protein